MDGVCVTVERLSSELTAAVGQPQWQLHSQGRLCVCVCVCVCALLYW